MREQGAEIQAEFIDSEASLASYQSLRQQAAWWLEPSQDLIEVRGKDAGSYLQTQLTQDVLGIVPGQGALAALVERKGHLRALTWVCRLEADLYWLLPDGGNQVLFEHLEQFHFVEAVSIRYESNWLRLRLEGPASLEYIQQLCGQSLAAMAPGELRSVAIPGASIWVLADSLSGESGRRIFCRPEFATTLLSQLNDLDLAELSPEAQALVQLEAGQPRWGQDMDESNLLPETGLEKSAVSYDKGCYLGQEVIARIRSYGVPPRALIGLLFERAPSQVGAIRVQGKEVGRLMSYGFSPQLRQWIGLAYLHKSMRENGRVLALTLGDHTLTSTVRRLPFYTPPSATEQAKSLLEQALDIFAHGDEAQAIPLLEAAIALDGQLADAYESLGVILSRQGRLEEAILVMKQLGEVAPDEPMAQTNLSRFYMLLGDKATAEAHMAEATRLNMLKTSQQVQAKQAAEQALLRDRAQKTEMMNMFREVLESEDPDDLVANFGLGKALLDLGQATEAMPYLAKATVVEPLYSAAWLQLGKACEAIGDTEGARRAYTRGKEAAAEKGDLMPLKEMEQRLAGLSP